MENKYVCSVDIGGTKIATAIMEYPADGSVPHPVFEAEVPTEAQEGGEAVFQRIEASIKAALEANPDVEVLGVGIGAAGVVDPKTGAIAYANEIMPGWTGQPVGAALEDACGIPAAVLNASTFRRRLRSCAGKLSQMVLIAHRHASQKLRGNVNRFRPLVRPALQQQGNPQLRRFHHLRFSGC